MFDPYAQRGRYEPGDFGVRPESMDGRRYAAQLSDGPMVQGSYGGSPYTGLPSVHCDQNMPNYHYGYGNSNVIFQGQGNQSFWT